MPGSPLLDRHQEALDLFSSHVHAVRDDQWGAPTPCAEWSVRDLVNHLTGEQLWVPDLVREGRSVAEVGDAYDGGDPGRLVLGVEEPLDEGRADDDAVREGGDLGGLSGVRHAEPDADRQVRGGAGAPHQVGGLPADGLAGPGDPHQGGGVDEAAARRGDGGEPLVPAAGRDDEDGGQAVLLGVLPPQSGLLHRQVGQDAAGAARLGQLGGEPLHAVAVDRVPVRHDEDRLAGGLVRLADRAHHVGDPDAAAQGDVVGGLDDGAVQDGVAVRQADLHDVGTAVEHGLDRLDAALHGGEARREVRDERGPVLGPGGGEGVAQQPDVPAHLASPSISAAPAPSAATSASVSYSPK